MSFAGHVFDMIRRNKECREMLELRRERASDARKRYMGSGQSSQVPDITAEEMERISLLLKEKELKDQRYGFRVTVVFIGIAMVVLLLTALLITLFL